MSNRNSPLPSLSQTAPSHSAPVPRRLGKVKKNVFSLDGYLSSTQPLASRSSPADAPDRLIHVNDATLQAGAGARQGLSPAEALLSTADTSLAPIASSSSSASAYAAASWRSRMLHCETELRELVAQGVHEPPSFERIVQVVHLYDLMTREMQMHQGNAFLGNLLRLFRVEFCRAIFLDGGGPADADGDLAAAASSHPPPLSQRANGRAATSKLAGDGLPQTYFDETASLQRTKAALTSSLSNGASGETLLLLERQIEDRDEQLTWYQSELERVRTQYDLVADECVSLRRTLETQQREAAALQKRLQQDIRSLHVENKDLQIQLFRLRKQISGGMAALLKDSYRQLKLSKIGLTQRLFSEGDERIALLVFLSQVESRVNEILDSYDNDYTLTPENGRRELQLKMAQAVTVLLEDMHYCEASYRRLIGAQDGKATRRTRGGSRGSSASRGGDGKSDGSASPPQEIPVSLVHNGNSEEAPDESDGYVAILFDPKIYEQFQARHAVQARLAQYKQDQEAAVGAARAKLKEEKEKQPFSSPDNGFMNASAATGKAPTRRETLSTFFSGMFATGTAVGRGTFSRDGSPMDAALQEAAAEDEKRKKWSLDSCTIASGARPSATSLGAALPMTPQRVPSRTSQRGATAASPTRAEGSTTQQPQQPQRTTGGGASEEAGSPLNTTAAPVESLEDVVERQKAEWVAQILGPSSAPIAFTVAGRNPERGDVTVVREQPAEIVSAEMMMRRVLHHPMEDLCTDRFLSTVEIFTGENPTQQRMLCRLNYVDPALPIRIPESTNFVKVKYALTESATIAGGVPSSATAPPAGAATRASGVETSRLAEEGEAPAAVFRGNPQLRLFKELGNKALVEGNLGLQYCAGAVNSTTASTVAYQRLHPMSPNRAPEWLLYQQLFGPYRSLAPRMMEVTTIDHIMACASERYFTRMEYRYDECYLRAAGQCPNIQLRREMTERLFKDMHALSDFQEALVDELEARYGFPELVAKTLYEMLCYLNAVSEQNSVLSAYLDVVRGFAAPTEIHFISYMLYHLSYCWPESNPSTTVPVADVRTVLEYLYRNASTIMPIRPEVILSHYDMSTRSAPLNFVNFREFIASTMTHQEESILLHLHGLFHAYTQRALVEEAGWETYEAVIGKLWRQKDERRSLVRYLTSCLGVNRTSSPTLPQLALLAASAWSSNLWE